MSLSACQTLNSPDNWPSDLPPLKIFVEEHARQVKAGTNDADLDTHLVWVKRFYKGSVIYPIGWNDMVETISDSFPSGQEADALTAKTKLEALGLRICLEWSQANDKRKIDSSNISVWGNALRTSVERQQQLEFIDTVERDVDSLLRGELLKQEISNDRYYPPEDYDNF